MIMLALSNLRLAFVPPGTIYIYIYIYIKMYKNMKTNMKFGMGALLIALLLLSTALVPAVSAHLQPPHDEAMRHE